MSKTIRWGILGTGGIASAFAEGLRSVPDAEIAAVGSRARNTAEAFGERFAIPRRHSNYQALAGDPDVDVIYVSTPHAFHKDHTLLCLDGGKAVLCEKPFAINAGEAQAMIARARQNGLFLMEAMWTRFLPVIVQVRQWLSGGLIGEVRMMTADFGFRADIDPESRIFNPHLGGGGLLDVGVYTISLATMVFGGPPHRVTGFANIGETGVDEQAALVLGYDNGGLAALACAVRTETPQAAVIMGATGVITIHSPFWQATKATLTVSGKPSRTVRMPFKGNGYNYEAVEVTRCLRDGAKESAVMPLDETLSVMQTMDALRAQWGFRYPME